VAPVVFDSPTVAMSLSDNPSTAPMVAGSGVVFLPAFLLLS
jgi:hypothetical protein